MRKNKALLERSEWDCKCGCGFNNLDPEFLAKLYKARIYANTTFVINSGCRCEKHNKKVGGVNDSSHLHGKAADIRCFGGFKRFRIIEALILSGFNRIGVYKTFIHVDADQTKQAGVMWYGN